MSDSTDNTTELDSYGVWVKRPGTTEEPSSDNFDIPDFPDPDTVDVFADFNDEDISIESVPEEEIPEEAAETFEVSETPDLTDFTEEEVDLSAFDVAEEESPVPVEEPEAVEEEIDFNLSDEDGEISLDEFLEDGFSDESVASGNNGFAADAVPASNTTEEVSLDEFADGEISLDDFLDGGDFTSSPAPEAKAPATEEIVDEKPLELDISFDASADTIETEDNIQTEDTFEDESDFQVDENISVSDGASHSTEVFGDTEEIDLSDFGIDANAEETPITQNVEESKLKDKVVDFDLCVSDEKMTSAPIVEEVKDAAPEEEIPAPVSAPAPTPAVETNNVAAAPVSNESNELLQQIIAELSGMKAEINALKANLDQMQNQKEEKVVEETAETVTEEIPAPAEETVTEETIIEETVEEPTVEDEIITEIPETTEDDSLGFFDNSDGDDTIALSGDELDNMLSNVEIAEEPVIEETIVEEVIEEPVIEETVVEEVTEEPVIEETIIEEVTEEPVIEETVVEEVTEEPVIEESVVEEVADEPVIDIPETTEDDSLGFFDNSDGDDTIALSGDELDNMLSNVEITEEEVIEETEIPEELPEETVVEDAAEEVIEEPLTEEPIIEEETEDIPEEIDIEPVSDEIIEDDIFEPVDNFEIGNEETVAENEEVLEEPDLDNITFEDETEDDLPEEITIEKTDSIDDILVESSKDDFMNSVNDSTETMEPVEEVIEEIDETVEPVEETEDLAKIEDFDEFMNKDPSAEESLTESNIDYLNEEPAEETIAEENEDFPSVDIFDVSEDSGITAEAVPEVDVIDEPAEEPVIEETAVEEPAVEEAVAPAAEDNANEELKKDIKSVLLYMDQLLENLPEEKIVEFAKSEEFSTYKKLFSELGLA